MPCPSKAWAMGSPTPPWPTSTAWSRRACSSTVWGSSDRDPAGRSISAAMRGCCRSHRSSGPTVLKIRGLAVIDSSAARMRLTASDDSRSSERPRVARMKENSPIWARLAATINALIVAASLAQIGEFSLILATLGRSLDLLSSEAVSLILAALLSITANPLIFSTVGPLERWLRQHPRMAALIERPAGSLSELPQTVDEHALRDHAVAHQHGVVTQGVLVDRLGQLGQGPGGALDQRGHARMLPQPPLQRADRAEDQGVGGDRQQRGQDEAHRLGRQQVKRAAEGCKDEGELPDLGQARRHDQRADRGGEPGPDRGVLL